MDALFPAILQNVPGAATMSAADQEEMRDFVSKTTQQVFGALGNGGGGMGDIGGIMSSILGGGAGIGGPVASSNTTDIHEHVDVDLTAYFADSTHDVKFHVRVFDQAINGLRKKKRKVTLTLPAGAPANHVIRVDGQGHYDPRTRSSGALLVHFHCKPSEKFTRHGQDLHVNVDLYDFHEDPFVFRRFIEHPSGRTLALDLPEGVCVGFGGCDKISIPVFGFPRFEEKPPGKFVINVVVDPKLYAFDGAHFQFTGHRDIDAKPDATRISVKREWISPSKSQATRVAVEEVESVASEPAAEEDEPEGDADEDAESKPVFDENGKLIELD
jgi:DnaJ-class molecular chaperone